jgi:hypothetical protein
VTYMSKANWPSNLVEELAYRRCILFLGSGVSATAKNADGKSPLTWGEFLKQAQTLLRSSCPEDTEFINDMLSQKNYLLALQAIYDLSDLGEYSKFLKDSFARANFLPSEVHKAIKNIDSKILMTTNFDKIYDNLCNEGNYVRYDYSEAKSITANIKSPENLIIKVHGNIDDTDKVIFTSKQYYDAQMQYPAFYSLLSALFLTNTVVFLGYSLSDPDINLILHGLSNTANPTTPHYVLVNSDESQHIKRHWKDTYNIASLEYGPAYSEFADSIYDIRDAVLALRAERGIP